MTIPQYDHPYSLPKLAIGTAINGSFCGLAAALTPIGAVGGAIFGSSSFLSGRLISWIADNFSCCPESLFFKITKSALSILGGIAAGSLIATAMGFPITFTMGVGVSAVALGIIFTGLFAMGCSLCVSTVTVGVALVNRENPDQLVRV